MSDVMRPLSMTVPLCQYYRWNGATHPSLPSHQCKCSGLSGVLCGPAHEDERPLASCRTFRRAPRRGDAVSTLPATKRPCGCGKPCARAGDCRCEVPKPLRRVRVRMPSDPHRRDGHGDHYNCSIIHWRGKLLMASRLGWVGSSVWLCELDDQYQPVPSTLYDLDIQHPRALRGVEDPRLFTHGGRLHVAFTGYDRDSPGGGTSQFYASLDDDLVVDHVHVPHYDKRRTWEKNWGMFDVDGQLHCVYSISPHVVLRVDGDRATEVSRLPQPLTLGGAQLRGGAAPVRVGEEFYSWLHTFGTDAAGVTQWGLGLYVFSATPPFRPLRSVKSAVLRPEPLKHENRHILYPCGAVLRYGKWVISYGVQDRECWVAEFDAEAIEGVLT